MRMASLSSEKECQIFKYLKELGCCLRCCFRFIGVRNTEFYQNPHLSCSKLGYEDNLAAIPKSNTKEMPCTTCLGLLQNESQETAVEEITAAVNRGGYDSSTFTCALTIPIAAQIRERSLQIDMADKFELSDTITAGYWHVVPSIKDVWKWTTIPKIESSIKKKLDPMAASCSFIIDVFLVYEQDDEECKSLLTMCGNTFRARSHQKRKYSDGVFSRKSVETAMITTKEDKFREHYSCPPLRPSTFVVVEKVTCTHASIFIGGRYNKYSRELSQTPWFINGEKKMETSVQELLCDNIQKFVKADSMKFLSSGREDVDVRTLNSGRPFAVELLNPRITRISEKALKSLVHDINNSTNLVKIVNDLKVVSKCELKKLKEGEDSKTKNYTALCICRTKPKKKLEILNDMKNLEILQKTPVRVLHRRPLATRPRIIHTMSARWVRPDEIKMSQQQEWDNGRDFDKLDDDNESMENTPTSETRLFLLELETQAGTYVKEFVHGDFRRTTPNLCEIVGAEIDIVALDVTGINLDWP